MAHAIAAGSEFDRDVGRSTRTTAPSRSAASRSLLVSWRRGRLSILSGSRPNRRAVLRSALGSSVIAASISGSVERKYWIFSPPRQRSSTPATRRSSSCKTGRSPGACRDRSGFDRQGLAPRDPTATADGRRPDGAPRPPVEGYHGNELGRYRRLVGRDGRASYRNSLNPAFWRLDERALPLHERTRHPRQLRRASSSSGPVRNAAGSRSTCIGCRATTRMAWVAPAIVKARTSEVTRDRPRSAVRSTARRRVRFHVEPSSRRADHGAAGAARPSPPA